jgi:hypothetical protein
MRAGILFNLRAAATPTLRADTGARNLSPVGIIDARRYSLLLGRSRHTNPARGYRRAKPLARWYY